MRSPSLRSRLAITAFALTACAVTFMACTGDDSPVPAEPGSDASTAPPNTNPNPNPNPNPDPTDAGADVEEITDGGDLPDFDLDAGDDDGDGGVDAGSGCATLTPGAWIDSTCSSLATRASTGSLTTATYELASVTVYGDTTFCKEDFQVYQHRGKLVVTASSSTTGTIQYLEHYRPKGLLARYRTTRFDADVTSVVDGTATKLQLTPSTECPGASPPPSPITYSSGTNAAGKKTFHMRMPYGKSGWARYSFIEP
jgi:hypothetical protein